MNFNNLFMNLISRKVHKKRMTNSKFDLIIYLFHKLKKLINLALMQFLCSTLWIQYSKKSEYKHKVINKQMLLFVNQGGPQHEPTDIKRKSPLTESLHVLHAVHCSCLLINLHITLSWQRVCITQGC